MTADDGDRLVAADNGIVTLSGGLVLYTDSQTSAANGLGRSISRKNIASI